MTDKRPSSNVSGYPASHRTLARAFQCAFGGIAGATRRERNLRLHWIAAYAVLALGPFLDLMPSDWVWLFLAITLVIMAELINTAIEAAVDHAGREPSPSAQLAKDTAAGAVLVASAFALVVAGFVILARNPDPAPVFRRMAERPILATALGIGLVGLVVWFIRAPDLNDRKCKETEDAQKGRV